ncbi:MAG: acyl carrier protein [Balneolaceae bacterium]|nr:MAG: acyl carrier protein [Balneolaceae bacterium]
MNIEEIKKDVFQFVYDNAFTSRENITDDVLIFKNGFLDSMGLVMLVTHLEDTFNIQTADADLVEENFESINAIAAFVEKKKTQ